MATVTAATWVSLALAAGSTYMQVQETKAVAADKGRAEAANAKTREIERKRNLIRSLAERSVRAGASGITSGIGSSAQALMLEDVSRKGLDTAIDKSITSRRISQIQQNASNQATFSLLSAGADIAGTVSRTKKRGEVKKPPATPLHDQTSDLGW